MKKYKGSVTQLWLKAQNPISSNKISEAETTLDLGLVLLSNYTLEGLDDKAPIEGTRMDIWKDRFWQLIENHVWPTRSDYEKNWK